MTPKQKILNCLTKAYLQTIASELGFDGAARFSKDKLVMALSRKGSVKIEAVLNGLSLEDLKSVCRGMGMDDAGRRKADLVDRIMGCDGEKNISATEERPSQTPLFDVASSEARKPRTKKSKPAAGKPGGRSAAPGGGKDFCQYRHDDLRVNNPPVGLVTPESDPDGKRREYRYDPHIDPALQFDCGRAQVEKIIDEALAADDPEVQRQALETLKRMQAPYLNWAGKAERTSFEVDTVSLHVHERIDPFTILQSAGRPAGRRPHRQMELFEPAFENLPLREAIDFYKHAHGWANRLIAGDSLLVMNSLLQKEGMAGKVQMIYIDPPYGIKYGSNFQPFVNKRDVKDRSDQDLTQEPEMIKAFRDTWELGLHSYLTYLRDRLLLAKELLNESGSVFVQISDENLHHVRELMDEIFTSSNFIATISFAKTSSATSAFISSTFDYLIWYAKDLSKAKYRQVLLEKRAGGSGAGEYVYCDEENGSFRRLSLEELLTESNVNLFRIDTLTSQSGGVTTQYEFLHNGLEAISKPKIVSDL